MREFKVFEHNEIIAVLVVSNKFEQPSVNVDSYKLHMNGKAISGDWMKQKLKKIISQREEEEEKKGVEGERSNLHTQEKHGSAPPAMLAIQAWKNY